MVIGLSRLAILSALLLSACAPSGESLSAEDGVGARTALTGSPDGVGLVAFLDDAATTLTVLDDQVPLDSRAATNLIAHRDGADGIRGTRDDNPFDTVEEVDAVSWVGPAAMTALLDYADAQGWIPEGDEVLGTWDGVSFTVDEADAVLAVANTATDAALDDDVPLDRRAVDAILAARPIDTVLELSGLYYVGGSALNALKDYASVSPEAPVCEVAMAPGNNAAAADLSRLVSLATMRDTPSSEVKSWTIPCTDGAFVADPVLGAALTDAIGDSSFAVVYDEVPANYKQVGSWVSGGADFAGNVDAAVATVDDAVTWGDWDPSADADSQALYDQRYALAAALKADAAADPAGYAEVDIYLDLSECSERAVGRVDLDSGELLVVHKFPGC